MTTAIGTYATAALLKTQIGIADTTDDTVLGYVCDRVNQYIETRTRRILAPVASAAYIFDGSGRQSMDVTEHVAGFTGGLRAVSLVEIAANTGAAFESLPSGDCFLRGVSGPGMPYDRLWISDLPTGGYTRFPPGFGTVRVTATAGPAAIPDDIIDVALSVATRAWFGIQSAGEGDSSIIGTDAMGAVVTRSFMPRELDILRRYTRGSDLA